MAGLAGDGAMTRCTRSPAAGARGMGGGKEVMVLAAGALVVFMLCVAFCQLLRRVRRYLRLRAERKQRERNQMDKWNKFYAQNHGPGGH